MVGYLRLAGVLFALDGEKPFSKSIEFYQSYPGHAMDIAKMLAKFGQEREQIEEAIITLDVWLQGVVGVVVAARMDDSRQETWSAAGEQE